MEADAEVLDSILFKFASTSDGDFEATMNRVLPKVLPLLARTSEAIRQRTLLILNHVQKRINTLPNIQLPVSALAELFLSTASGASNPDDDRSPGSLLASCCLMFLDKGMPRMPAKDRFNLAPALLNQINKRPTALQKTLLQLFLSALQTRGFVEMSLNAEAEDSKLERWAFVETRADLNLVLQFFLDALLYVPNLKAAPAPAKQTGAPNSLPGQTIPNSAAILTPLPNSAPAQPPAKEEAKGPLIPAGMSQDAADFITNDGKVQWNSSSIAVAQEALLSFLIFTSQGSSSPLFRDNDLLPLAIAGSCSGDSSVSRKGEDLLRKLHLSLEDASVVKQLMTLFMGQADANNKIDAKLKRSPASEVVRLKLLSYLNRSITAANQGAVTLKLILDCLLGANASKRLHLAGLQFLSWVLLKSSAEMMKTVAHILLQGLLKLLQLSKPVPKPSTGSSEEKTEPTSTMASTAVSREQAVLRGRTYNALGQLSLRAPTLFNSNTKMMLLFFQALQQETETDVQQNIHEGLALLRQAYASTNLSEDLQTMLSGLITSEERRVRLCALQCMNRLFPFSDVRARYMSISLTIDPSVEVRDEARRGLSPALIKLADEKDREKEAGKGKDQTSSEDVEMKTVEESSSNTSSISSPTSSGTVLLQASERNLYPAFPDFVNYASQQFKQTETMFKDPSLPARILQQIIDFAQQCFDAAAASQAQAGTTTTTTATTTSGGASAYAAQLVQSQDAGNSLNTFRLLIERAFEFLVSDVQVTASRSLVRLVKCRPQLFAHIYTAKLDWLKKFLLTGLLETRKGMSKLLGVISDELDIRTITRLLADLTQVLEPSIADNKSSTNNNATQSNSNTAMRSILDSDAVHGSVLGLGVLIAQAVKRQTFSSSDDANAANLLTRATHELVKRLSSSNTALSAAICTALSRIGEEGQLPLAGNHQQQQQLQQQASSSSSSKDDNTSEEGSARKKHKVDTSDVLTSSEVVKRLLALTNSKERRPDRLLEHAIQAVGAICVGDRNPTLLQQCVDGLFELSSTKLPEVHFAVGRALVCITTGQRHKAVSDKQEGKNKDVMEVKESKETSLLSSVLETIIFTYMGRGSVLTRSAGCVWLLCLVKFAGWHPEVRKRIQDIQLGFSAALTEADQFTQECAGKGMGLLYQIGDPKMREDLLASLVKTFAIGRREVNAETRIQLSDREEFSTYKELCTVANDMGQPDLIYKFLDLASHHSIWNSKLGAAFSLGSIVDANKQLAPHLQHLIPKLYRYQFDPNKKIQQSIKPMWRSLVPDARLALNQHFDAIMTDLMQASRSRQFRERISACLALCDLLAGRQADQIGLYLEDLWKALFLALDDINEPVRMAASTLAKTMTQMAIRLCDPKYTPPQGVISALAATLPVLLEKGITDRAVEVRSVSINAVLKIAQVSGTHLRPHLPGLIGALLEGQSSLEPQTFSYLQFHTSAYNLTQEQLEQVRLQMAKTSPLSEALDSCLNLVDNASMGPVVGKIVDIMRAGVGLPTLNACARAVCTLAQQPDASSHLAEHAPAVIRALLSGLLDQSPSVRKAYAQALGFTCRVAKQKQVAKCCQDLLALYLKPDSENNTGRLVSGIALKSIVRRAADHARSVANEIAPVALIAMQDDDKDVAQAWTEVWEDLAPGKEAGCRLYLEEIVKLTLQIFSAAESSYILKQTALKALADAATTVGLTFASHLSTVQSSLIKGLPGRLWDGKETILNVLVSVIKASLLRVTTEQAKEAVQALINEAKRTRKLYKRAAVKCLGELVVLFPGLDAFAQVREVLSEIFESASKAQQLDSDKTMMSTDSKRPTNASSTTSTTTTGDEDEKKADAILLAHAYECLGQAWPQRLPAALTLPANYHSDFKAKDELRQTPSPVWYARQKEHAGWTLGCFSAALNSGHSWNLRVSILKGLKRFLEQISLGEAAADMKDPIITPSMVTQLLQPLYLCLADAKYSAVRVATLEALIGFFGRADAAALTAVNASSLKEQLKQLEHDSNGDVQRLVTKLKTCTDQRGTAGKSEQAISQERFDDDLYG